MPWVVAPAEDLARGADVQCLAEHTVAIVPHRTAWTDVGGMCWSCSKPICARNGCAKRYVDSGHKCENFERRLDEMEAREALRKAVG